MEDYQDAVFWVDIDLAIRKGLTFYQTRSNAIILQGTLPACCIPKVVRLKTGEVLYEKPYMSPRPPPKISLRHDWTRVEVPLGSTVDQQPEGKVVRQSRGEVSQHATFSQLTQPIPKPICDRSGQPDNTQGVFVVKGEASRSQDINEKCFHEELCSSDRSGQPDITLSVIKAHNNLSEDIRVEQTHDRSGQPDERNSSKTQDAPEVHREITMLNTDNELTREIIEEDIDFKIPGLPHSTVKQLHRANVRELIQKIENHPHRHALQRDLQQSQSFNPFSPESKQMIHEVGNIELCLGKHAKLKEKQKWSNEKLHLENARKLREIYFIDPEDKEFKETIKNARKKLETSVAPAMPCKILKNCGSGGSNKIKTKLAYILEADESTRLRMVNSMPHYHLDHIAGKGEKSLQHYNLVHKFIPMPQAMKIPAAKAAVDKEWEKLEKISAWNLTKVRSKKEVIDEARTSGATVHFASLMDICHLKNAELEAKHQKCKGRVVLRGDIVKDDSGSYAVFTEQGSSASQMTAAKIMDIISRLPGCDGQAADAVSAYTQVKMEDAHKLLKIPKSECPDIWIRLPRHKWPKSWSSRSS